MPDLNAVAQSVRTSLGNPLALGAGVLLLLFGRRLYWLMAGVVGFRAKLILFERLIDQ